MVSNPCRAVRFEHEPFGFPFAAGIVSGAARRLFVVEFGRQGATDENNASYAGGAGRGEQIARAFDVGLHRLRIAQVRGLGGSGEMEHDADALAGRPQRVRIKDVPAQVGASFVR